MGLIYFKVGFPRQKILKLDKEGRNFFKESIKRLNGLTNIYRSLYDFVDYPGADTAIIDKVYFDFDCDGDDPSRCQRDVKKLSDYLSDEGFSYSIFFSGNGFHLFLYTEKILSSELQNPKAALANVWDFYVEKLNINVDEKPRGDVVRICRVPNTVNKKTGRFCIPLFPSELELSRREIFELAQKPRKSVASYRVDGTKKVCLKEFDGRKEERNYSYTEIEDAEDIETSELPLCTWAMLKDGDCDYRERFAIITALRDLCFSKKDTIKVLRKYLKEGRFVHCIRDERQVDYLFERDDLSFPSCDTIKDLGFCVKGCEGPDLYY